MGNPTYRLPINSQASYVIQLYPGCKDCAAAPGIIVRKVDRSSIYWDELQEAPLFPLAKVDDYTEGAIKCGLDPDEFRKGAMVELAGTLAPKRKIDAILADVLAEDLWNSTIRRMPQVIAYEVANRSAE